MLNFLRTLSPGPFKGTLLAVRFMYGLHYGHIGEPFAGEGFRFRASSLRPRIIPTPLWAIRP